MTFLYYQWCEFFHRVPIDDEDFVDGVIYMEITGDLNRDAEKRMIAQQKAQRGRR